LSLVAAVAKLHGGRLELSDNHPGLRARLILLHEEEPGPRRIAATASAQLPTPAVAPEAGLRTVHASRFMFLRRFAGSR
jgi:hypothetical protein